MDLHLFKHVRKLVRVLALLAAGVAMGVLGWRSVHDSLWLDEAWIANSVRAASLGEMFWGGEWLQTSPPLFLLIARGAVAIFGLTTETFRAIPLIFAFLAGAALFGAARYVAREWAPVLCGGLWLPVVATPYFLGFKQYAGEAAAAAVVLWAASAYFARPTARGFVLLTAAVAGLLPLAYCLAFVAPGIVVAIWRSGERWRAVTLASACGVVLLLLYAFFIRPNVAPSLWAYWGGAAYSPSNWTAVVVIVAAAAWALWRRDPILTMCVLPCVLLIAAELAGIYPNSPRTNLFARPCVLLALAVLANRIPWPRWVPTIGAAAVVVWAIFAATRPVADPVENYAATVRYLHEHVRPQDRILIHPASKQGMELYFAMEGWHPAVTYGNTGWPCCPRGQAAAANSSSDAAVRADFLPLLMPKQPGVVWLVYTNRALHWRYVGFDEGARWRSLAWEEGCPPLNYLDMLGVALSPMSCGAGQQR